MPEYPDISLYIHALTPRIKSAVLERCRVSSPFLVRTFDPPLSAVEGRRVRGLRRLGKRIVFEFDDELFVVLHLMIAGRLRWREKGAAIPGKIGLAAFDFSSGTLLLTEASPKKRAALHVVRGAAALAGHDPGGVEIFSAAASEIATALRAENHTLKRVLTDPHVFSGIGNAYSDEILHRAGLSPLQQTSNLSDAEIETLFKAMKAVLAEWTERLIAQTGDTFPENVTAFRPEMAVHGKFGQPCPVCGAPVQRIVYAANEANYCAACQTGGKLLADRALSRLLKKDWPKTLEELEERKARNRSTS